MIPLFIKISSAAKVVGPLAPSTTDLHYNFSALPLWTDFSTAAGTKKSHYFSMNTLGFVNSISSACLYPSNVPFSEKYFLASSGSIPFELKIAELYSIIPVILPPS